jgi:hypothetical protein
MVNGMRRTYVQMVPVKQFRQGFFSIPVKIPQGIIQIQQQ